MMLATSAGVFLLMIALLLIDPGRGAGAAPRDRDTGEDREPAAGRASPWAQLVGYLLAAVVVVVATFGLLFATCAGLS